MSATPQETAARRYRIEKYLTEGGMGAIYIGKKMGPGGFEKEVVLKQLLPEYTSRPEFRDLFFREAKISATLDHANIVHTFDLVESDQSLFIVMEYVRGADLRTIVRRARQRRRDLTPAAAIHIALEILAGLSYAHTRKDASGKSLDIIHRDVSPSNIICSVNGEAKLSDFGIAKASTYSSVFYRVRGKVGYMSPEQARSQTIDQRCDLFSLAVCLYESLSSQRLFVGDLNTPADEIYGHPILPVSTKRPGLPSALDDVLMRALAPNVDDRYQTAKELSEALGTVAHRKGLAFSAPELAAHLRDILGDDPERWLRDDPSSAVADHQPAQAGPSDLVGKEAASIGIVSDVPGDDQAAAVLSPKAVTGSRDFDIDSMLNDDTTHPGGEVRTTSAAAAAGSAGDGRVRVPSTPPPVWTRDSAPFPLATPHPARSATPTVAPARRSPSTVPAAPLRGRALPRPTQRTTAVPPPFAHSGKAAPPPAPAPRFSQGAAGFRSPAGPSDEIIEDATPSPPRFTGPSSAMPPPASFDIEDALTPHPMGAPGGGPASASIFRPLPPAPYPSPEADSPLVLMQPQTMDFSGAVAVLLPEKKGGPPIWLAAVLILGSTVAGVLVAHRTTHATVAALAIAEPMAPREKMSSAPSAQRAAPGVPTPREGPAGSPGPSPGPSNDGMAAHPPRLAPPTKFEPDQQIPPSAEGAPGGKAGALDRQPAGIGNSTGKRHASHFTKKHRRKH